MIPIVGKARTKPYELLCHEALFRRLKPKLRNNATLHKEYARHDAGYQGERDVDYMLSTLSLKNVAIYRGIRLKHHTSFQMDTLIVTPAVAVIIEIKNMTGELSYDAQHDQFIQTTDAERKRQQNPIHQSHRQKRQLNTWLNTLTVPAVPIETLSVISNPNAILANIETESTLSKQLIHMESLPTKLTDILQRHPTPVLDQPARLRLDMLIHTHDTPYQPDLIRRYGLTQQDFVHGILCPDCDHALLVRITAKWACPNCGSTNKHAHHQALLDYFLLHGSTITNRQCRHYLNLSSRHVAYELLKSMQLKTTGKGKSTKYHAPPLEKYPQNSAHANRRRLFGFTKIKEG